MFIYLITCVISIVLFHAFFKLVIKFLRDELYFPSFSFPSFSFSFLKNLKKSKKKDLCELPDKQKDFIQLN